MPSEELSDLTTPELLTSWTIEPGKVNRAEVAARVKGDPEATARSNQALDDLGYGDTVPMYRVIKLTDDGEIVPEELISATLDPSKVPTNINFLMQGKFSATTPTDYRVVRYDVPRDRVAGYLPALSGDITQKVNKAVKQKGFGQEKIEGLSTVTNPAKHAKSLLNMQDEIIADVSGLEPRVLADGGKPLNMLSLERMLPNAIASGEIKTIEDFATAPGFGNYSVLSPRDFRSNPEAFEAAERAARQKAIDEYSDFFGIEQPVRPMVKEAGSDGFVPLEKKVGAPGTPGVDRSINKPLEDEISVDGVPLGGIDYLPVANALLENTVGAGKKGLTGAQYLARLKNQPSVTDMELEVSGLDKFLAENANRKIPVDDVLDYHVGNSPRIEMIDGGAGNVSYQRMFGDESYTAQGRDTGIGGYEEVVFRDARFAAGNKDLAPGAVSDHGQHHSELGPIGHGRMTSFDDVATGGERSTMLEENQADLYEAYKGGAAREAERKGLIGRNLVQLTPDKVKTFKAIEQKIEDGAQYRTLNDALTSIDDETRMLKEIEKNQRTVTADLDGIRKRNFLLKDQVYDVSSPEFRFAGRLGNLMRSGDDSPADIMGREMRIEADLGNIIKQAVIEDTRALKTLSNDQISKVLNLAADRSMRMSEDAGRFPKFKLTIRNPVTDAELKEALDIPEAITGAEEDVLIGAGRLIDNVQNEFKNIFEKNAVRRELDTGPGMTAVAVGVAKNLLPKAANSIDPKLLRKDADSFRKLSSEDDLFKQSIDDQKNRIEDAKARPTKIYMDAIEAAAPDKKTAFEYVGYRQNQGKLAVDDAGVDALKIHFSQDSKRAAERGFADPAPDFTNPLPFETQEQVARYQLHQMIKKAADDGSTRFYIPDYRDIFAKRELEEDKLPAFVSRYKTPQEKVIKELKQKYPDIDIGTVDTVQPAVNRTPLRDNQATKDYMLEIERPEHDFQ